MSPISAHVINEPPLLVLPSLAKKVGINHAILLQQMHYWLRASRHHRDGHVWVYNTYAEWQRQLPWLTERGIRKIITDLVEKKYIFVANHNRGKFDQTRWYRINYDLLNTQIPDLAQSDTSPDTKCHIDSSQSVTSDVSQSVTSDVSQSVRPIPENTETTQRMEPDGSLEVVRGGKPAVQGDTPAHRMVNAWYGIVGGHPTNHGRDLGHAKTLLRAGLSQSDLGEFVPWLRSTWFGKDGIDLGVAVRGVNQWQSVKSAPAPKKRLVV